MWARPFDEFARFFTSCGVSPASLRTLTASGADGMKWPTFKISPMKRSIAFVKSLARRLVIPTLHSVKWEKVIFESVSDSNNEKWDAGCLFAVSGRKMLVDPMKSNYLVFR
jgi:hypothetical protein